MRTKMPSKAEFLTYDEGMCVQCLHVGSYDDEPATVARMHEYMEAQGYVLDITSQRMHHEIYLSDARKVAPEKLKTVIRHPIRKNCDSAPDPKEMMAGQIRAGNDRTISVLRDTMILSRDGGSADGMA